MHPPRAHQAHQDQLGILLARPVLKAVHWNRGPAASGYQPLGLVCVFLSPVHGAIDVNIGHIPRATIVTGLRAAGLVSGRPPPPPQARRGCECPRGFAASKFLSSYLVLVQTLVQDLDRVILVLDI